MDFDKYKWCNKPTKKTKDVIKKANDHTNKLFKTVRKGKVQFEKNFNSKVTKRKVITSEKLYKYSYKHIINYNELYGKIYAVGGDNRELLILDKEKLSKGHKYWEFSAFEISTDEKMMVFCIDYTGDKIANLYYKYFFDDKLHEVTNPKGYKIGSYHSYGGTVTISKHSNLLFYLTIDHTQRTNRVWVYDIYEPSVHFCLLYEGDEKYSLSLSNTSDNEYVIITSVSKNSTVCYLVNVEKSKCSLQCIFKERPNFKYYVDHYNNKWYFLFQEKLIGEIKSADHLYGEQELLYPHKPKQYISSLMIKGGYILIKYKVDQNLQLLKYCIETKKFSEIIFKGETKSFIFPYLQNINPYTPILAISYQTFLTPPVSIKVNLNNNKQISKCKVIKNYNMDNYVEKTVIVNKAKTAMTLLYNKNLVNLRNNKKNKCLMHVYGAYGSNYTSSFDLLNQSLMDKGYIICYAHVRGTSYYGKRWYFDGRMSKKMNTFTDTIDCAEFLIKNNITSRDLLTLWGRSAGGLTVGAVINMRPDLFNLAILGVPFVDVINEMMNKNNPLTTEEYQEWGNPRIKKQYEYISKYSPYQNIKDCRKYPKIYIYSNMNDTLVGYWVPLKYYLRLLECDTFKENPDNIYLHLNTLYGHGQASNRFEHLGEMAQIYAIIDHFTN